ncbi:succinate--hydroxymethylglutarate CoA-transferase [Toxorhynchites rutilus septentrionalis]|uniref:succinate--hydroxymethylglutarate CoA-transferase n=1 Tax=Toxorhynchites rutilus septentrionalis TaxID=329112 RepID=UPI00247B01F4|nr:succinate--hydroxymethylglutarate CoA-transferase [Toxorhynchites rutilus septentrionalis]
MRGYINYLLRREILPPLLTRCFHRSISSTEYPLEGIKILDLTRIVAGPYCTMILSDLGADVYKIEKPFHGDESRKWGPPFLENSSDSVYFTASNRNKKSVCIDLKKGKEIIHDLASKCDVLVENYIPGKLSEMGLGYDDLKEIAPSLIYCSITGYGQTGPYRNKPGYDVIAASIGGLLHITGNENGPPAKVGVAITDIATGLYAHGAILAALLQRQRTNRGQKIDVNLLSTQVACLINVASNYLNAGKEAKRWGTAHESIVPYEAFATSTGHITIGCGSNDQFTALCDYLDIPEIAEDERFATNQSRVEHRQTLVSILSQIIAKRSSSEWMQIFTNAPFPVGPINKIAEVFQDPHIRDIDLVKRLSHPTAGEVQVVGPPVVYSEARNCARTAPPLLGQHTDEVLRALLNYSEKQIEQLREKRIIQ